MHHITHLSKDRKLKKIIQLQSPYEIKLRKNIYLQLVASITSQQLSTRVAEVIYHRFLALYGKKTPTLAEIAATPIEVLRGIGLSNAKANYVHNVCAFFLEQDITDARLRKMTNEEVIHLLTQIKGVGKWTVEMILMSALGREDVFSVDDLGIQQGMAKLYGLEHLDIKELKSAMLKIAESWSPYRTYACRYLWGWKDAVADNATK